MAFKHGNTDNVRTFPAHCTFILANVSHVDAVHLKRIGTIRRAAAIAIPIAIDSLGIFSWKSCLISILLHRLTHNSETTSSKWQAEKKRSKRRDESSSTTSCGAAYNNYLLNVE